MPQPVRKGKLMRIKTFLTVHGPKLPSLDSVVKIMTETGKVGYFQYFYISEDYVKE